MSIDPVDRFNQILEHHGYHSGKIRLATKELFSGLADRISLAAVSHPAGIRNDAHGRLPPGLLFLWTVEGQGILNAEGRNLPQNPRNSFVIQTGDEHDFQPCPSSLGWKYLRIRIDNPWLTDRIGDSARQIDWTFPVTASSRLGVRTLQLFQQAFHEDLRDSFHADEAFLLWSIELRRHIFCLIHPRDQRMEILERAQQFYVKNKNRSFGVEDFSATLGMTRSRASVWFRQLTGKTIAAYFLELKLRDAVAMLEHGYKLKHVAQETGFSDANHLCKTFRRVYQSTPGQLRKVLNAALPALAIQR